jgi:hypothetical protein
VKRVVIVVPGLACKSTLAARLGEIAGLPVVELDELFWRPDLTATPPGRRAAIQRQLAQKSWIMDGDLGSYDVLEVRLQAADTVGVPRLFSSAGPARRRPAGSRRPWPPPEDPGVERRSGFR